MLQGQDARRRRPCTLALGAVNRGGVRLGCDPGWRKLHEAVGDQDNPGLHAPSKVRDANLTEYQRGFRSASARWATTSPVQGWLDVGEATETAPCRRDLGEWSEVGLSSPGLSSHPSLLPIQSISPSSCLASAAPSISPARKGTNAPPHLLMTVPHCASAPCCWASVVAAAACRMLGYLTLVLGGLPVMVVVRRPSQPRTSR